MTLLATIAKSAATIEQGGRGSWTEDKHSQDKNNIIYRMGLLLGIGC